MNHPITSRLDSLVSTVPSVHFPRVREEISSWLPSLPNELWLQIFEWATFVPDVLDPDIPNSLETAFFELHYHLRLEWRYIDHSLETKYSIVRVCRRWHALATPLLYQAVIVTNVNMHSLHRTLKEATEAPNGIMLGSLVRRLDVCLERETGLPMLGEIYGCLSHLRILTSVSIYENDAQGAYEIAASNCSPTLQKLVTNVYSPSFSGFLERLPNLRTLYHADFCPYVLPPLPNLRSMALDNCHNDCAAHFSEDDTPYPNLRHIFLRWDAHLLLEQTEYRPCALELLSKRAPRLTTIHIEALVNISKPVFRALAENCPHLTHLGLHFLPTEKWTDEPNEPDELDEYISDEVEESDYSEDGPDETDHGQPGIVTDLPPPPIGSPPPVIPQYRPGEFPLITHLALVPPCGETFALHSTSDIFTWLAAHMPPSLQVVQLLDRGMVYSLHRKHSRNLARALEKLPGVRVEDHKGTDLRDLLPHLAAT